METNALPAKPEEELIPTRASLLARLKDLGDDRSWTEFLMIYRGLVRRCALNAGLSEADADEVFQETVIAVSKRMPSFCYDPAVCSFKTWLYQIVRARIADHYRQRGRRVEVAEPVASNEDTSTAPLDRIP